MVSCPSCGEKATHLVWEDQSRYDQGMPPKFVGCTSCNEMNRFRRIGNSGNTSLMPSTSK